MATFTGFTCDRCEDVVSTDGRTKVSVKFEGSTIEGQYTLDLCETCAVEEVPDGATLKPLRRRRKSEGQDASDAIRPEATSQLDAEHDRSSPA